MAEGQGNRRSSAAIHTTVFGAQNAIYIVPNGLKFSFFCARFQYIFIVCFRCSECYSFCSEWLLATYPLHGALWWSICNRICQSNIGWWSSCGLHEELLQGWPNGTQWFVILSFDAKAARRIRRGSWKISWWPRYENIYLYWHNMDLIYCFFIRVMKKWKVYHSFETMLLCRWKT